MEYRMEEAKEKIWSASQNLSTRRIFWTYCGEKSAYYDFNKKFCKEQQSVHEDNDINITLYNNSKSNNEYCNGMSINIVINFTSLILRLIVMCYLFMLI